jgi:hypothetical protein
VEKRTEYTVLLETEEDVLRCELTIDDGKVTRMTLQYEADIKGEWREVVRYDTSHGFLHRHRFWLPPGRQIDAREDSDDPVDDYTQAFERAKKDLTANWRRYRKLMQRSKSPKKGERADD